MLQKIVLGLTLLTFTHTFAQTESSIEFFDNEDKSAFSLGWTRPATENESPNFFKMENGKAMDIIGEFRYISRTPNGQVTFIDFNGISIETQGDKSGDINNLETENNFVTSKSIKLVKSIGADQTVSELRAGALEVDTLLASVLVTTPKWKIPDYVFADDYQLQPLAQVESFVKENKHLPEIPSEADIKKNGLDLVHMNILLLKKVEELTLHTIALNKQMQYQASELQKLKRK